MARVKQAPTLEWVTRSMWIIPATIGMSSMLSNWFSFEKPSSCFLYSIITCVGIRYRVERGCRATARRGWQNENTHITIPTNSRKTNEYTQASNLFWFDFVPSFYWLTMSWLYSLTLSFKIISEMVISRRIEKLVLAALHFKSINSFIFYLPKASVGANRKDFNSAYCF